MSVIAGAPARASILSPALVRVFVASFGSLTSFFVLASVVPRYAASVGAGAAGAGLSTAALMFATVGAEFAAPWLAARFGYRSGLAAGLILLGAPALALPYATGLPAILAVAVVRGVGFAIVMVLGDALIPLLVPDERRGEALGLGGVVASVPGVVALPLGAWLVDQIGYTGVFVVGAVAALAALVAVPGLPEPRDTSQSEKTRVVAGLRNRAVFRPALAFGATAVAGGIVTAFLPLAVDGIAPAALLVQAAAATVTRWWAGRQADRRGAARLLVPAVALSAAGMLAMALTALPAVVLLGALVFGAGFGAAQNASMATMFDAVPRSGYGMASALWNMAFDGGYGLGAAGCGIVAAQTGYPASFALTALVVATALVPARQCRRSAQG
jgi:predicted MFS family arabinose efflux permease